MPMQRNLIEKLKAFDAARPEIPGEHWIAFGAGVALWLGTRRHPSFAVRLLGSVGGTALVARAVTGRDVPPRLARWLPFEHPRQAG